MKKSLSVILVVLLSALCMAEGLQEVYGGDLNTGHLYTFEINDEQEDFTRKWIEGSPWADRVTFVIGDAAASAPALAKEKDILFDLAFVDGDKRTYIETYEALLPLMSKGGYILADNTLWYGRIVEEARESDLQTLGLQRFNDLVAQDERVEKVILPLRDGLTIIRKK